MTARQHSEAERTQRPTLGRDDLHELAREAAHCRACDVWKNATQTVFGAGRDSKIVRDAVCVS